MRIILDGATITTTISDIVKWNCGSIGTHQNLGKTMGKQFEYDLKVLNPRSYGGTI